MRTILFALCGLILVYSNAFGQTKLKSKFWSCSLTDSVNHVYSFERSNDEFGGGGCNYVTFQFEMQKLIAVYRHEPCVEPPKSWNTLFTGVHYKYSVFSLDSKKYFAISNDKFIVCLFKIIEIKQKGKDIDAMSLQLLLNSNFDFLPQNKW